jgi:hypothetical protein
VSRTEAGDRYLARLAAETGPDEIDRADEFLETWGDVDTPNGQRQRFTTITVADVEPERVTWLWEGRLPAGKLATLDGDPGLGKSTLALTFAAVITTAGCWPDATRCHHPGDVVVMSAEDGLADTIRPRLDAAGADVTRVHVIDATVVGDLDPRAPTLADTEALADLITGTGARLAIVDVFMAFLPSGTDSHRDQDVRTVLARLAKVAADTGCTVLLLRHLNKAGGHNPLYRGGGSIGIVGAARVALVVAVDPEDEDRRVLAWAKNNLAPLPDALAYRLTDTPEFCCARVVWDGHADVDVAELLDTAPGDDYGATAEAKRWLEDYLTIHGACENKDVKQAAAKVGIAVRTLQRACKSLGVVVESSGYPRVTYWSSPAHEPQSRQSRLTNSLGATGATGAIRCRFCGDEIPENQPLARGNGYCNKGRCIAAANYEKSQG